MSMTKEELSEYKKQYYIDNREKILEKSKLRRLTSSEHMNDLRKNRHRLNPAKELYRAAKRRAKNKSLEFSITLEYIVLTESCPILQIPLIVGDDRIHDSSPSLDRIDNSKGYVKGNVQVISNLANRMKNSASNELLIEFANWILNNTKGSK
jgi:hypothetical protein